MSPGGLLLPEDIATLCHPAEEEGGEGKDSFPARVFPSQALQGVPGLCTLLPYQLLESTRRQWQLSCLQSIHINKVDAAVPVETHAESNLNALIILPLLHVPPPTSPHLPPHPLPPTSLGVPQLLQAPHDRAGGEQLLALCLLHLLPCIVPWNWGMDHPPLLFLRPGSDPQANHLRVVFQNVVHNGLLQTVFVVLWETATACVCVCVWGGGGGGRGY